jgi:hypothetical protein
MIDLSGVQPHPLSPIWLRPEDTGGNGMFLAAWHRTS